MTAFVDLKNKKIVGAKENSLTWFHEKGHIVYNEAERGMRNEFQRQGFFNATIFFLVINCFWWFGKYLAAMAFFLSTIYSIYEEAWCWSYAFRERRKFKHGK